MQGFVLFPLETKESQKIEDSLLFLGSFFPYSKLYHFWGSYQRVGSQVYFHSQSRLIIRERKKISPNKPKLYLGCLWGLDKKFIYISSLFPLPLPDKLRNRGFESFFLFDYMRRNYILGLTLQKAYFWEMKK